MSPVRASADDPGQLRLTGELDAHSVPGLLKNADDWLRSGSGELKVELAAVERADSAGVALLLDLQRRARAAKRPVRFADPPDQMRAIIGFCALDRILDLT